MRLKCSTVLSLLSSCRAVTSRGGFAPNQIILIRHGESTGNVDKESFCKLPVHLHELTATGISQSKKLRQPVYDLCKESRSIALWVSPYHRAQQTTRMFVEPIKDKIVRIRSEPRLREQEYGTGVQVPEEIERYQHNRKLYGRFWYRFPEGESTCDVHHRVVNMWNELVSFPIPVDTGILVTHGLTMRVILMAHFGWSPDTFESVYNPGNCSIWVLNKKFEQYQDRSRTVSIVRYEFDKKRSDPLRSDKVVTVHFKDENVFFEKYQRWFNEKMRNSISTYDEYLADYEIVTEPTKGHDIFWSPSRTAVRVKIPNYLSIPQPRSLHWEVALTSIGIDVADVHNVDWDNGLFSRLDHAAVGESGELQIRQPGLDDVISWGQTNLYAQ